MRSSKYALIAILIAAAFIVSIYVVVMYKNNMLTLSLSTQDWGAFGSYIGGVLAPFASLIAGVLVYQSFKADTYYRKVELVKESLLRLDNEFHKVLIAETQNSTTQESNITMYRLIVLASNEEIDVSEDIHKSFIALLQNLAIHSRAIEHYLSLLDTFDTSLRDRDWLINNEKLYWFYKYAAVANRLEKIVGKSEIKEILSEGQLSSAQYLGFLSK
ncbi:hypothetical protein ACVYFC_18060 [Vibrio cholerae]